VPEAVRAKASLGLLIIGLAAVAMLAVAAVLPYADLRAEPTESAQRVAWSAEAWPFPIDQWGTGQAFGCSRCGAGLHRYLRPKIGFCRCGTGVSDDDEIDRVGDTELLGSDYKPIAPGHAVEAGVLKGRARLFTVKRAFRSSLPVLTIALANKCDAVVATLVSDADLSPLQEQQAVDFLRSEVVQRWAKMNTGSN
jgi:hypothetical protein